MSDIVVGNQVIYYDFLLDYMYVQLGTSKHKISVVSINNEIRLCGSVEEWIPKEIIG